MKVHAVKLEYRKQLLGKIVHGYFKVRNGKNTVIVTFDPDNPKVNNRRPKTHIITTRTGKDYYEKVLYYAKVKAEYELLLKKWNDTYCFAPPKIKLPLTQFYDPHKMDNEFFDKQEDCRGRYVTDKPSIGDSAIFKSKNELMAADALNELGIPFKYETELFIPEVEEWINPDFLLNFYEIDRCSYLEVLGMNDKFNYAVNTSTKINSYSKGRYRPGREVIYVHLYDKHSFDKTYFIEQVLSAFNGLIPDSALEWGSDYSRVIKAS